MLSSRSAHRITPRIAVGGRVVTATQAAELIKFNDAQIAHLQAQNESLKVRLSEVLTVTVTDVPGPS